MAEHDIDELLRLLDERSTPDPTFDQRLRARLRAELGDAAAGGVTAGPTPTEEVFEVDTVTTPPIRRPRWLPAAAAAAIAVAVAAGVIVATGDDDASNSVANAPDATFAGATIEETPLDIDLVPFYVGAGEHVWVLSLAGQLHRIDADGPTALDNQIHQASTMAVDENAVWIADAGQGDVLRLDPDTGELVATIATGAAIVEQSARIPMLGGTLRPFATVIGIAADGDSVWAGDERGEVLHIDPATNEIDRRLPVPVRPQVLRIDGDQLLVMDRRAGEAAVVDVTDGDVLHSVSDVDLAGAALHDGVLYLQSYDDGSITRIDLATGTETHSAPLGQAFRQPVEPMRAPSPVVSDAGLLVDVRGDGKSIRVLDPTTLEELDALDVVDGFGDMTLGPDGSAWVVRSHDEVLVHITPVWGGDD